jgi:hypothetical protein
MESSRKVKLATTIETAAFTFGDPALEKALYEELNHYLMRQMEKAAARMFPTPATTYCSLPRPGQKGFIFTCLLMA